MSKSSSQESVVDNVHDMLTSQSFAKWYEGTFMDYVEGEEDCKSEEEIKEDIKRFIK